MLGNSNPNAIPGTQVGAYEQQRQIFYADYASAQKNFAPCLRSIDAGTAGSNIQGGTGVGGAGNKWATPYTNYLWAGLELSAETNGQLITSVIGTNSQGYVTGATSFQVDVATAVEMNRRIGASGTFIATGDNNIGGGGTVTTATFPYSSINVTTGVVTVTAQSVNLQAGALIGANDGSAMGYSGSSSGSQTTSGTYISTYYTLIVEIDGYFLSSIPPAGGIRCNVIPNYLWGGGGIVNVAMLPNYPQQSANLKAFYKGVFGSSAVSVGFATFSDLITG